MLTFFYHIKITKKDTPTKGYIFENFVNTKYPRLLSELEISSNYEALADVCTLKIGNLARQLGNAIGQGDKVEVYLGYNDGSKNNVDISLKDLNLEFSGFVTSTKPNFPFEITAKDLAYGLERSKLVDKAWKTVTLLELLKYITKGYTTVFDSNLPKITLTNYRISNSTPAQALEKIKSDIGLIAYFRANTLYVGFPYFQGFATTVNYDLARNVLPNTSLEYITQDNVKLKARAVSILANNTKVEVEAGDSDGEVRTLRYTGISDKAQLKKIAEQDLVKLRYEGYKGSITTFGIPFVQHSNVAKIKDSAFPLRQGEYFVNEVKTTVSSSGGFRREVQLGRKVGYQFG